MDLMKIGKYIASKRKSLGLTQAQLAEKLGMSDKSVSKWERGICLPDVSVYIELCDILGISLNEFIAGEDLTQENVIRQSEENLIQISADGNVRRKKLQRVIVILLCVVVFGSGALFCVSYMNGYFRNNYIAPIAKDSTEMKTAEVLSGVDGADMYRYTTDGSYKSMTMSLCVYENGRIVSKEEILSTSIESEAQQEGMIAIVPEFDQFKVKVVVADGEAKYATKFRILEGVNEREYYGRSASEIERNINISKNTNQGLVVLIYDNDELHVTPVEDIENEMAGTENDYMYYLSVTFNSGKM